MDEISELGSLDPYLLRGWRYLFSRTYRETRRDVWRSSSTSYVTWDVFASVVVMIVEAVVVVALLRWLLLTLH